MEHRAKWAARLVALTLLGAAIACSVQVSTAHLEDAALYSDAEGATRDRSFTPQDRIYVIGTLKDAPENATIRAVWSRVTLDEQGKVVDSAPVDQDEQTGGDPRVVFEMTPPDPAQRGWPRGDYRVELFINGERAQTLDFSVA